MGAEFNEWRKIICYFSYLFNDCKSAIFLIRSKNANQVMMVKGIKEINCHWDFGTIISFFPITTWKLIKCIFLIYANVMPICVNREFSSVFLIDEQQGLHKCFISFALKYFVNNLDEVLTIHLYTTKPMISCMCRTNTSFIMMMSLAWEHSIFDIWGNFRLHCF